MLRRFWDSTEGGIAKATGAAVLGLFAVASALTGAAVLLDLIAGAVR
jgi:hypothetical protein